MKLRIASCAGFRRGVTLIELLVVMAIVIVLLSLTAAAVHAARGAARRALCSSRLLQLGIAVHGYEEAHRRHPLAGAALDGFTASPTSRLLPFFDQPQLADSLNWSRLPDRLDQSSLENDTAVRTRVSAWLCPADRGVGGVNYFYCAGVGPRWQWWAARKKRIITQGFDESVFQSFNARKLGQFQNGLGNAVLYSERLQGDDANEWYDPSRDVLSNRAYADAVIGLTQDEPYSNACQKAQEASGVWGVHFSRAGLNWLMPDLGHTAYNHAMTPNSRTTDCGSLGPGTPSGIVGARSNHTGGVNVLFGDGRVEWVGDSVNLSVWLQYSVLEKLTD